MRYRVEWYTGTRWEFVAAVEPRPHQHPLTRFGKHRTLTTRLRALPSPRIIHPPRYTVQTTRTILGAS